MDNREERYSLWAEFANKLDIKFIGNELNNYKPSKDTMPVEERVPTSLENEFQTIYGGGIGFGYDFIDREAKTIEVGKTYKVCICGETHLGFTSRLLEVSGEGWGTVCRFENGVLLQVDMPESLQTWYEVDD